MWGSLAVGLLAGSWAQRAAALALAALTIALFILNLRRTAERACPPVVEYSRAEQARVAAELAALPEGAVIPEWLTDYAVLREQTRACR